MRAIDAWMQHPTPEFLAQPFFSSLRRWTKGEFAELPIESTLGSMDAAGIGLGLLSAWWGPGGPLIPNDTVAGIVQKHPDRFRGVAAVNAAQPVPAVRELRRCVAEHGFVALRIIQWLWDWPSNHRRFYPLYAACAELGIPACLQVGHTGPLCPSEPGRPIPYLDQVALDFPELTIVGGHIGYPWTEEMIALATKYENVYIDTSAYVPKRYPPQLVAYLRGHGRRKVLFGTNFPMLPHARCAEGIAGLELDTEAQELFLHGNAERVFALSGRADCG